MQNDLSSLIYNLLGYYSSRPLKALITSSLYLIYRTYREIPVINPYPTRYNYPELLITIIIAYILYLKSSNLEELSNYLPNPKLGA